MKNKETRYQAAAKKAKKSLGGKCIFCKSNSKLQFHHIEYSESFPKRQKIDDVWTSFRLNPVYEALKNPERFALLCQRCHRIVTFVLTDPQRTILVLEKIGIKAGFDNSTIKKIIMKLKKV